MKQYDVTDSAVIDADADAVFSALVDVHDGATDWWEPHFSMRLVSGESYDTVGAVVANIVRVRGRFPIRFDTRTTAVVPGRAIDLEYIGGAFRGTARWMVDPEGARTAISMRWQTRPAGMLRFLAWILPVEKSHSDAMHDGFAALREHLSEPG